MANPRQRRKARSGNGKVKQSRRQQDKLRKVVVTGPEVLRKEWDIKKTALQNLEKLGLARRPLALRQNGGTERAPRTDSTLQGNEQLNQASDDEDAYASESDEDDENPVATTLEQEQSQAGPSSNQPMDKKSKDIPKGFARIIRDDQGNVIDVVMSAYDEAEDHPDQPEEQAQSAEPELEENEDTPWGRPLVSRELETRLQKAAEPVPAKSAALRQLEERTAEQSKIKAASLRFASSAEQDYLRQLVKKHGTDISAMAKDFKLNQDQRTAGQLRKAFARCGGVETFTA